MRKFDLIAMQFEELWQLYEELTNLLADKVIAEKRELESRLVKLGRAETIGEVESNLPLPVSTTDRTPRRKYPKVLPKYRNPLSPSQTWSGRGKRPRWVVTALETGQRLDDLRIENVTEGSRKHQVC
jgi:DNA-binding protein H-NS